MLHMVERGRRLCNAGEALVQRRLRVRSPGCAPAQDEVHDSLLYVSDRRTELLYVSERSSAT